MTGLDDAIRSCPTLEMWTVATAMFPASLDGASAEQFLRRRCALPGLAQVPLCHALDG